MDDDISLAVLSPRRASFVMKLVVDSGNARVSTIAVAVAIAAALIGAIRIAPGWRVFSQTFDEPAHLAAGFQWLEERRYAFDLEHPPLARIVFAIPSVIGGGKISEPERTGAGNELLHRDGRYRRNLALARAGNLPFFLLALAAVFFWATRLAGAPAGALSVVLLASLPPVLGHAGVATTDMAATATTAAALAAFAAWLDRPGWRRATLLGLAIGAGLLSKFTFLLYFPAGALLFVAARMTIGPRGLPSPSRAAQIAAALVVACFIVWAGYLFSVAPVDETRLKSPHPESAAAVAARYSKTPGYEWVRADQVRRYWMYAERHGAKQVDFVDWAKAAGYPSPLAGRRGDTLAGAPAVEKAPTADPPSVRDRALEPLRSAWDRLRRLPLPAPEFLAGLEIVAEHSANGHWAFLLGEYSQRGWWYYFPVVLFFKTPIAFLALALAGLVLAAVRGWRERRPELVGLAFAPLALLLPAMAGDINIGVRHVLPLYPLFAMAAAVAIVSLWRRGTALRVLVVVLLVWYAAAGAIAHPDYLSDFNEAAGGHPERIATDSNLDWGQDLLRLEEEVRRSRIDRLYLSYFGTANLERHDIPAIEIPRGRCVEGWIAVSDMHYRFGRSGNGFAEYRWLTGREPVRWIGDSIRLYYVPPGTCGERSQ